MNESSAISLDDIYLCRSNEDLQCADTCISLLECSTCECAITEEERGPWGSIVDVLFCLLPVAFLVFVTVKRNPLPTSLSLPLSAVMMYLIRLMYLGSDPLLTTAAVIKGLHEALTPLSIMAGAIFLFETMEVTLCLPYLMTQFKSLTEGHAVAEAMLLFAFCYAVEGASGFGTPAALGAPLLVSLGHDSLASVVVLLIFNTTATIFGAVGTPIWFGFGETDTATLQQVGKQAALTMGIIAFIVVPWVLTLLVPFRDVRANIGFVFASLLVTIGPAVGVAYFSYEFPTLIGGVIGCVLISALINFKVLMVKIEHVDRDCFDLGAVSPRSIVRQWERAVSSMSTERNGATEPNTGEEEAGEAEKASVGDEDGASKTPTDDDGMEERELSQREYVDLHIQPAASSISQLVMRSFPIWGSVVLLLLTRLDAIGLKGLLQLREPSVTIPFGTYGSFSVSPSFVFQLENILSYPGINWRYELLYVPFLLPFIMVSTCTYFAFRSDTKVKYREIVAHVIDRLKSPALALMGALVLVQLMILRDDQSPAFVIGSNLSDWLRQGFVVVSPLLGALGSFFSGSTTVSNLTFARVQSVAASAIGLPEENLLALQVLGASAGNGICLNNIIAVCTVVGLNTGEGPILVRTAKFVFAETTLATVVMLALFIRF